MKLSNEQIQELYKFTRKRLVEHYDLQTELVDHLANGIEEQWQSNSELSFKEALQNEFKKFGHFGFRSIIKKRKKVMAKRYRGHILEFYKEYFRLPKVLIVLGLSWLMYSALQFVDPSYKLLGIGLIFLTVGCYFAWFANKNKKLYHNKIVSNQKRWMLEEKIYELGEGAQMAIFPFHIFNSFSISDYLLTNSYLEFAICFFSLSYLILSYVMVFVIPQKAEKLLAETYPEYKMV
ncbi:hypothetical protein [Maribacter sp. 2308TA10-17]|uniref:hypothetical protein n=1 Tax=Maribacter sp. 2308TA10-17 TaxID=3386276 RepID=UPI0039BD3001